MVQEIRITHKKPVTSKLTPDAKRIKTKKKKKKKLEIIIYLWMLTLSSAHIIKSTKKVCMQIPFNIIFIEK